MAWPGMHHSQPCFQEWTCSGGEEAGFVARLACVHHRAIRPCYVIYRAATHGYAANTGSCTGTHWRDTVLIGHAMTDLELKNSIC